MSTLTKSHPVCGGYVPPGQQPHPLHLVYIGGQPGEWIPRGAVGMPEQMRYAVDFAEPTAAGHEDAEQVEQDKALGEAVLARSPDAEGYATVSDVEYQALRRLVDEAKEYAITCGYEDDPTCTPVERSMAGFGLVCWKRSTS